ncbi:hypothetical protein CEXT_163281 [Caerostris extrusa]|uniref:Uncharacterized protein n=1 Tax=Caerostris extrusa TaxID=172846 RepID=A0AAV4SXU9_CAEEX|nr:hypothetical protein CEXT_163281 [Caerostris extrusa]
MEYIYHKLQKAGMQYIYHLLSQTLVMQHLFCIGEYYEQSPDSSANSHTSPRCLKCGSNYLTKECHIKENVDSTIVDCINCSELEHTEEWKSWQLLLEDI